MQDFVVILDTGDASAMATIEKEITASGGRRKQSYGRRLLIVEGTPKLARTLRAHPGVLAVHTGAVPDKYSEILDETAQLGIAAWNHRQSRPYKAGKKERIGEGLAWDHPDFEREG